LRRGSFYR